MWINILGITKMVGYLTRLTSGLENLGKTNEQTHFTNAKWTFPQLQVNELNIVSFCSPLDFGIFVCSFMESFQLSTSLVKIVEQDRILLLLLSNSVLPDIM